jgi:ankyrin repeat protein
LQSEIVIFLTEKCPAAAKLVDKKGMTPLHLAVSVDDPQLAVVEDLTEVKPEAGVMQAKDGSWPLWTALPKSNPCILKDLIVSNPESAKLLDEATGATVLHRAIELDVELSIIKDLIKVFPRALEMPDKDGRIPLFAALEAENPRYDVVKVLVQKYPEAVELTNAEGKTPHELSVLLNLDKEITKFLNPYEDDN